MSDVLGESLSEQELCPENLLAQQEAAFARDIEKLKRRRDEFVEVPCPACSGNSGTKAFEKYSFSYITCSTCRTLYMSPRPSPALMADYYQESENYQFWAKHIFPASEEVRREKIHRLWLQRVQGYCLRYNVEQSKLIEVGAGFGTFSSLATEVFAEVIAIEPTPDLAENCRRRSIMVIEKKIEDITDEVGHADVLVSFEVIEHLFEPKQFIEKSVGLIKSGGLLVLSCPNGQGFDISLLGANALAVDAEHVNLFNPASLSRLVESCGFEVLEVNTPGRLDAEFVHEAIKKKEYDVSQQPFLKKVLLDEWESLGWPFQQFLAEQGLSSHMWLVARKK